MTLAIYLAAACSEAAAMRVWAETFRVAGFDVLSSWHDSLSVEDPAAPAARRHILYDNLLALRACDVLFADTRRGVPSATFGEIAVAADRGKRVVWIHPPASRGDGVKFTNIWDAHDRVTLVRAAVDVLPTIAQFASAAAAPTGRLPQTPDDSGSFAGVT